MQSASTLSSFTGSNVRSVIICYDTCVSASNSSMYQNLYECYYHHTHFLIVVATDSAECWITAHFSRHCRGIYAHFTFTAIFPLLNGSLHFGENCDVYKYDKK